MLCNNPAVNCDCVLLSLVNKRLTEQYQAEFISGRGRHGGNRMKKGRGRGDASQSLRKQDAYKMR